MIDMLAWADWLVSMTGLVVWTFVFFAGSCWLVSAAQNAIVSWYGTKDDFLEALTIMHQRKRNARTQKFEPPKKPEVPEGA